MTDRMTREQALERVREVWRDHPIGSSVQSGYADLLMAVQSETEARVVAKCCEIADGFDLGTIYRDDDLTAQSIKTEIRAAFPDENNSGTSIPNAVE